MFLHCDSYLRVVQMFWHEYQALHQLLLYEDLLKGEQVDAQATVHEGLLRGEQADVYSHRSSMSCCGTTVQGRGKRKQQGARGRREGGKEEDNREITRPRINESCFLPYANSQLYDAYGLIKMIGSDVFIDLDGSGMVLATLVLGFGYI